jgi:hypothetical protein
MRALMSFCIHAMAAKAIRYDDDDMSFMVMMIKIVNFLVLELQSRNETTPPQVIGPMHGNQQ